MELNYVRGRVNQIVVNWIFPHRYRAVGEESPMNMVKTVFQVVENQNYQIFLLISYSLILLEQKRPVMHICF